MPKKPPIKTPVDLFESPIVLGARRRPPVLPVSGVFYTLFFRPSLLFILREDKWTRALRFFLTVSFLCGMTMAAFQTPAILRAARDWTQWLGNVMGTVWVDPGGQLHWERPRRLPWTAVHDGWRVEIVGDKSALPDARDLGPENQGIWISPTTVVVWAGAGDRRRLFRILENGVFYGGIPAAATVFGKGRVDAVRFRKAFRHYMGVVILTFMVVTGVYVCIEGLFYTFMFSALPFLLRSPIVSGGFARLLALYLYAAIPPMIAASIYSLLNLPLLDHSMLFVIGLVLYLAVATRMAYRELGPGRPAG